VSDRPLDALEASLDDPVTVELKDGRAFHGLLDGYDQHMNVVLVDTAETVEIDSDARRIRDKTIIRGDNVVRIET
jgi:Small nuclear ribonucleoprotein (snRNP) homolog